MEDNKQELMTESVIVLDMEFDWDGECCTCRWRDGAGNIYTDFTYTNGDYYENDLLEVVYSECKFGEQSYRTVRGTTKM